MVQKSLQNPKHLIKVQESIYFGNSARCKQIKCERGQRLFWLICAVQHLINNVRLVLGKERIGY